MKILENLIKQTKKYKQILRDLSFATEQYNKIKFMYDEQSLTLAAVREEYEKLVDKYNNNKTIARRIIRKTNSLLKKDELVPTKKEIQSLCHEIIKG